VPDVEITEGRLIETATPGARGMERRAFGEFVGPRGELASYALGWTTGTDQQHGRLTIGIGAGNPGGATFHADILNREDEYGFALVDEPFEDVPEGGPHLTAEQARAHEDLKFIWFVADAVLVRDRRAWWLKHWLCGTPSISTPQVFDLTEPILLVTNDSDDELWQLIGESDPDDIEEAKISHLYHAVDADPTLLDVLDLEPGEQAERDHVGGPWTRGAGP
jgi:hypothetical protein